MMDSPQSASLSVEELHEVWPVLSIDERLEGFRLLPTSVADDFFLDLSAREQAELITHLPASERRTWVRLLPPDDLADLVQAVAVEPGQADAILAQLDDASRREVNVLLAYAEDDAGGLMNPRFARVRPEMTIDEAIGYLRKQAREKVETVYYAYALDAEQRLQGVLSLRQLFQAASDKKVADVMQHDVVTVSENTDQEVVSQLFTEHGFMALPVLDEQNRMKGIVTVDDIVDVVQEEATEDIQKVGGMEALEAPYFEVGFFGMLKKRIGWLLVLFLGQMLTATAMSSFEGAIERAVVLSLFVPLIISSGGNSGSQASTLIIRALALGEMRLKDWWRVARREVLSGLVLGFVLGAVGLARIVVWQEVSGAYGEHAFLLGCAVALSVLGVVTFGTLAGSMLPLVLRRFGFDPASASAPFVATLVDVSGVVIYFTVASLLLRGTLL
ncbi:magnesium transporter [Myxococcus sp. MISCRS1]|jgi:magnesium transporter|uniref:magnesium transporter n=1 Tax=Myxococcus TaxID=32 RepID=UPI001CBD4E4E|nr:MULTISPECIES: magnesium transporter [unclassified Myxococcus]MBZ4395426.1 magnesium transporter [Myxococcus sp. AS-1-15]MBZ4413822.1 magnesium transporter [Myxococcus sp. XM-1-1-1]MCY0999222.1 magnesium transporter [Myxococcus sp. MISCRS1]BDT30774.1 magnesium transporter [Myxococcus sp. MH1]